MPDKKLTDNEIVNALKELLKELKGKKQLIVPEQGVKNLCYGLQNFLDLINRLQTENEKYEGIKEQLSVFWDLFLKLSIAKRKEKPTLEEFAEALQEYKTEAYKECIEKVKESLIGFPRPNNLLAIRESLDNLLKEVEGDIN